MEMSGQYYVPAALAWGRIPGTHRTGGSEGRRAGLDISEENESLAFIAWGKQPTRIGVLYEGWNFNFGYTPLDWIQELLE